VLTVSASRSAEQITNPVRLTEAGDTAVVARTSRPANLIAICAAMLVMPWVVWGSAIAQANGLISWRAPQGLALWVLAPSILAVTALTGGRDALRDLGRRLVRWRVPIRTYLLALVIPMGIAATVVVAASAVGLEPHIGATMTLPAALVYLVYGTGLFLLTEEAGWRGLLLPRMQYRWSPLTASLLLGVIWGLWHLPLLSAPGEADNGLPLTGFLLLITATSVLITAVTNLAYGSVLLAALCHAVFDAAYSYTGVVGTDHTLLWIAAGVTTLVATSIVIGTRGTLFRPGQTMAGTIRRP
jgi:membrane protease YdiL (CAAX protease family)